MPLRTRTLKKYGLAVTVVERCFGSATVRIARRKTSESYKDVIYFGSITGVPLTAEEVGWIRSLQSLDY